MLVNGKKLFIKRFSSKEMKLIHNTLMENVSGDTVDILYNNDITSFLELIIIIKYYLSQGKKVNLTLTYLPYQRMDHNNGYEVETLKLVASVLNDLNLNSLTICEPHCSLKYFNNAKNFSFVDVIMKKALNEMNFQEDKDILFFTDKGAKARYEHLGTHFVTSEKVRDKETGLIVSYKLLGKIEKDSKIIIVDDIVSTGDTIMRAIEELKKYTNKPFYIVCGHFERNKYNKRLLNLDCVEKVFSSNSLTKRQSKKLKLFDVEELLYGTKNGK